MIRVVVLDMRHVGYGTREAQGTVGRGPRQNSTGREANGETLRESVSQACVNDGIQVQAKKRNPAIST